jgi:hypothetical protein
MEIDVKKGKNPVNQDKINFYFIKTYLVKRNINSF